MTISFSEVQSPETFAPARTLRGVIHSTDRFRVWVEDPQHDRWPNLYVPEAVGEILDAAHVRLFYDMGRCLAWADRDGVAHVTFEPL